MSDNIDRNDQVADEMAEYLPTFIDETEEQLDDLVETMLALERDPTNTDELNEAFRLIHSIKGSAGMMGFDNITVLTHHLENRFERFRSAKARLDEPTMNLVLRCIDFLRQCNKRLRNGDQLGSSADLLNELKQLERQKDDPASDERQISSSDELIQQPAPASFERDPLDEEQDDTDGLIRMIVRFRSGLQLVDLKAQLIVARLSSLGNVKFTRPDLNQPEAFELLRDFEIHIEPHKNPDDLRNVANVDGVESVELQGVTTIPVTEITAEVSPDTQAVSDEEEADSQEPHWSGESTETESEITAVFKCDAADSFEQPHSEASQGLAATPSESATDAQKTAGDEHGATEKATSKLAETMRVDIDRLDHLMNLAGELVINRARFVQVSEQVSPALRKGTMLTRVRDFGAALRRTIESLENAVESGEDLSSDIYQLRAGLRLMEEQSEIWENDRHCFGEMSEAIDQLSRVSDSLQRGVMDTRMVPVGPLFNRFKRVVRDLSKERGKKVEFVIRGEKTELDKRMIDELSDPLVHLVRNSIDHGLESPDVRARFDKPESGMIVLEASQSGNSVYIHVRDDGGGIDVAKIKAKLIENHVLSESAAAELSDEQSLEYIWHPGFSTAKEVTDVSGRGVGMDAVKNRIQQLNGTVEIESKPQHGTTFTIRLPLTLAIINSLLVRTQNVAFSMPVDDVREIVSVNERDVTTCFGKQTVDVRGRYIPLVSIDDVFDWHRIAYGSADSNAVNKNVSRSEIVEVVVLQAGTKTIGLRVDELLANQDVVIKSLSDNFIHIRGLSGASILGDGSVCLMLDVGTVIDMVTRPSQSVAAEDFAT